MSDIDVKYAALGGPGGWLGTATTEELIAPDGIGHYRHYRNGSIYWSPSSGAHEVHGDIRVNWSSLGWERSFLGYPLTDETTTPDGVGRYNHFQGGSIYWTPGTGALAVAKRYHFDGSALAAIPVASPWGIGLLKLSGNALVSSAMVANGSRLGEWLLNTADNQFGPIGDFDGDGQSEILVASPWGIGVLKRSGSTWSASGMTANGTRIGQWLLNTADNSFSDAGDLDGDGHREILVQSPWGIGILKLSGSTWSISGMVANGSRLGEWLLNTADNQFGPISDFDGDGHSEILVTSPWGLAIFKWTGTTFSTLLMAPNGTRFGGWLLDTTNNRFEVAGNFFGDGRAEILVTSPWGLAVLRWSGSTLDAPLMVVNDSFISGWRLNTADNRFGPVGDFDGDGRSEILLASPWGIGVLDWRSSALEVPTLVENGNRISQWLLNTADNRLNVAADFDGDGSEEILLTSPWGVGILHLSSGQLRVTAMAQNGTRAGDWLINTADNDLEMGSWDAHAVLIYHNDWASVVQQTGELLRSRGYAVQTTDKATDGFEMLRRLALSAKPGDRVLVYLAGHGSNPRPPGNTDRAYAADHFVQFNNGELYVRQLAPLFASLANQGADLSVFDGSCNGGETVCQAARERYCAMSTTGVTSPGLTNFPNLADALRIEQKPSTFGLWWAEPHLIASWLNGTIIRNNPTRSHQRLFRNDRGEFAQRSIFFRPAVDCLKILDLGGWNLRWQYCYLYPIIYPDDYNTLPNDEQAKFTNDTKTYMDAMNAGMDAERPIIAQLKQSLSDRGLMTKAAAVYAAHFARAWQTLVGDSGWEPLNQPDKYLDPLYGLSPRVYQGEPGFHAAVSEYEASVERMEQWYQHQSDLLWKIDAAAQGATTAGRMQIVRLQSHPFPIRWPSDPAYYREFNQFERALSARHQALRERVRVKQIPLSSQPRVVARVLNKNISQLKNELKVTFSAAPSVEELVAEFKAISVEHSHCLGWSSFLLSLIEDAVSQVQSGNSPGDLNFY